jgi:predicted amidohydrolase YtcJ
LSNAHFHLIALANKGLRVDLSATTSAADVVARLASTAGPVAADAAIVGVYFDESDWRDATLPTRNELNAISATQPVYARRVCCHVGVANEALLQLLAARVPARFVDGETGRITEDAVFEANRLTRPADAAVAAAMDGAIAHLHALGITAIHDIVDPDTIEVYGAGLRASQRPLRIDAYLHLPRKRLTPRGPLRRRRSGACARGRHQIFSDGSMGARTAALHEPYADDETRGDLLVETRALAAEITSCAEQGIVCAVHAIGDRALATVLDAIGTTRATRARVPRTREVAGATSSASCDSAFRSSCNPTSCATGAGRRALRTPARARALGAQQSVRHPSARRCPRRVQLGRHAGRAAVRIEGCHPSRRRARVHRGGRRVSSLHDGGVHDVGRQPARD